MNDLISRSKVISVLEKLEEHSLSGKMNISNAIYLLEMQPTAFDIDKVVDEFGKAPAGAVLPAQIQSGGTGLNIQSASVVIICEPQFKPSIENQAVSRAYRMGQTRNVLVYRLLCEDSVDERITEILKEKQNIFDAFADESSAAAESLEIDSDSFGNIIDEEIKRINKEHASEENKQ